MFGVILFISLITGFKEAPWGFLTARNLDANCGASFKTLKMSTRKTNMAALYDRAIGIKKGV